MAQSTNSPFDFNTFVSGTTYDATKIDYEFHRCPPGEYMAQVKEFARGRELDSDKFNGRQIVGMDVVWSIQDETIKGEMNLDEVNVPQGLLLEMNGGTAIDFGTNRNMALKNVMKATGADKVKSFNLGALLHQVAWVKVEHEQDKRNPDVQYARVTRVMPLEAGRAAYEASRG